jgi:hypothetical protein
MFGEKEKKKKDPVSFSFPHIIMMGFRTLFLFIKINHWYNLRVPSHQIRSVDKNMDRG